MNNYKRCSSDLEKFLFYKDESKKQLVQLIPVGAFLNNNEGKEYFANYELNVREGDEEANVDFGEYKAIINCIYRNNQKGRSRCCSMSIKEFSDRFLSIVKKLVPKDIYNKYLKTLEMGKEGIFRKESGGRAWL